MSYQTMTWASQQRTGSPGAKAVLMAIANYADEHHECYPFISTLAFDSEQSYETVRRKLQKLEELGLIETSERVRRDGSRSSNLIRLLVGSAPKKGAMPDAAEAGGVSETDADMSPQTEVGSPQIEGTLPAVSDGTSPHWRGGKENNHLTTNLTTPLSPPAGGGVIRRDGDLEDGSGTQLDTLIAEFKAADPLLIIDRPAARRQWAGMSSEERARALAGVARYLDRWREAGKKFKLRAPSSYLKGRIWNDFAAVPAADLPPRELSAQARAVRWAASGTADEKWVFVAEGSSDWREWRAAFAAENMAMGAGRHMLLQQPDGSMRRSDQPGRRFPMLRPPPRGAPAQQDAAE